MSRRRVRSRSIRRCRKHTPSPATCSGCSMGTGSPPKPATPRRSHSIRATRAALRSYGLMLALESRYGEALACVERARELDPLCLGTSTHRHVDAVRVRRLRRRDRALPAHARDGSGVRDRASRAGGGAAASGQRRGSRRAAGTRADVRSDSHPVLLSWLAHVKAVLGCRSQAQALIARARSFERTRYVPPFHLALAYHRTRRFR